MKHLLFIFLSAAFSAQAGELKVAAAADLKFALDEVIQNYQHAHPAEKVTAVYGASGMFLTQIKQNAPFDLFLSADREKAQAVLPTGKAAGEVFAYAQGHLVLWVRRSSKVNLDDGLKCLLDPSVHKVAVANAVNAPYGRIAEEALRKSDVYTAVQNKLVVGENISQTAQFVESGAADVGLIAKSLALSPALKAAGHFVDIDPKLYSPLVQAGIILQGANVEAARKFKDYFLSAASKKVLSLYGLTP